MAGRRTTSRRRLRRADRSSLGLWTAVVVLLLVAAYLGVIELSRPHVGGDRLRFDTFVALLDEGRIRDVKILDEDSYVVGTYTRPDGSRAPYNAPLIRSYQRELVGDLVRARIPVTIEQQVGKRMAALASVLLPGLMITVLFVYLILSYRRGTGLFNVRSGARPLGAGDAKVTFADVAGQDAAVAELREIRDFLADPRRFADVGAAIPKGVLLYGPPGSGKTLLARALAAEAGAAFYSISGSDFVELYVGVGAARVRDLFKEARAHAPALIFIDELDSIGRARGATGMAASHGEQEQGLNQILAEMDGFSSSEGILVIGATNRPDVLDQALLRPGRFDRTIGLERPDEKARLAILEVHARGKRLEPDVDLATIAARAFGLTGADLAGVMNEAALLAVRAGKSAVSQAELDQALQRVLAEPDKQRRLSIRERSIGRRFSPEERVTFADVAGVDDAVEELDDVRDYLANPEAFARMGARVPRGILLSGPPGCGKTLLARAVAGEANAAFFSASGSDFVEVFVGVGASRVRDLFAEARAVAPAIVFIDEIDSLGGRRAGYGFGGHREADQTLNQILVELDGFEDRSAVIVMGATNRPDLLDPALVRPGRFDRQVEIAMPDREGRCRILELHARGKPLASGVDLEVVAGLTRGFSGADLANVMNEAALLAARRGIDRISMTILEEAIDRATLGVTSRRTIMSEEERRSTACHEAGHALVALALPAATPPHKLTVVPRGGTLGHCRTLDSHDRVSFSRSMLIDRMAVGLGGRLAEELFLGESHTGAAGDLALVREIARQMVCDEGMSEALRGLAHPDEVGPDRLPYRRYSEEVARVLDLEIRKLVDEASGRARWVLTTYADALERLTVTLLEKETLGAKELEDIAGLPPNGPGEHPATVTREPDLTRLRPLT
jgi:cell division protease FtsH